MKKLVGFRLWACSIICISLLNQSCTSKPSFNNDSLINRLYGIFSEQIAKEIQDYITENDSALAALHSQRSYWIEFKRRPNDSLFIISAGILRPSFSNDSMKFVGLFSEDTRFVLIYSSDSEFSQQFYKIGSLNSDIEGYDDSYYLNKMPEVDIFPIWEYRVVNGQMQLLRKSKRIRFRDIKNH